MEIRNYSVAAHLIHSRLQLIAKKIRLNTLTDGRALTFQNYRYFYRAGESVKRDHGIHFRSYDLFDAGDLFLKTVDVSRLTSYFVVQQQQQQVDEIVDITSYDLGVTISPADPNEKWTKEQAVAMKDAIIRHHKIFGFSVVEIFEYK